MWNNSRTGWDLVVRIAVLGGLLAGVATLARAAPFDLVSPAQDVNGIALNPIWVWQQSHPGQLPDNENGAICSGNSWEPPCTSQNIGANDPDFGSWNWLNCKPPGHRNWELATYTGQIFFQEHSDDDDYNINLYRPDNAGQTVDSARMLNPAGTDWWPVLHLEFNASETIDDFGTSWWTGFHSHVDNGAGLSDMNGADAIAIGLFGQDIKHAGNTAGLSELHPLFGLAVHVHNLPGDDEWAIFVRNSGNEGPCSDKRILWRATSISFLIPRIFASNVGLASSEGWWSAPEAPDAATLSQINGPNVALVSKQGALVTFTLPPPDSGVLIDSVVHLVWTIRPPPQISEDDLNPALRRLTPAEIAALNQVIPRHRPCNRFLVRSCANAGVLKAAVTANLRSLPTPPSPPGFIQAVDPRQQALDKAKVDALRRVRPDLVPARIR